MDARSERNLAQVEPDLGAVMRAAAQMPQPFVVIYGIRTVEAERAFCATGNSQTMHSRHLADCHGLAAAVDVAALVDGKVSFAPGKEKDVFGQIAQQVLIAADLLEIPIMWGGADVGAWQAGKVSHFHDWGHFQLPVSSYPSA